jgi:RNA polymerase sigma factor (TIGR02999 family)
MHSRPPTHDITQLLQAWGRGDQAALDRLMPMVYQELRLIAKRNMARERPGHTLQATALVNEVYIRLVDETKVSWQDRAHFFAICARTMRRILVDFARSRQYQKRGGGEEPITLDESLNIAGGPGRDLLAIHDALTRLAALDPRKSEVVELRFFGGLSVEETAESLKISPETVMRDWKMAKAWLYRDLGGKGQ